MTTYLRNESADHYGDRAFIGYIGGQNKKTTLNDIMQLDHVVQVHSDGSVTDHDIPNQRELWAPDLRNGELDSYTPGWNLISAGYTGQDRYNGPIMHNSEYIGGRLADDILAEPGYYVALPSEYACDESHNCDEECESAITEGWAVAYREPTEKLK